MNAARQLAELFEGLGELRLSVLAREGLARIAG